MSLKYNPIYLKIDMKLHKWMVVSILITDNKYFKLHKIWPQTAQVSELFLSSV